MAIDTRTRQLSSDAAKSLRPGDGHYTAYVGPPLQYDFMGATQFRLLTSLGLRAHHRLLDFGCGSLRAGRLLIPYLDKGCYFGIEPNRWLIEDAIANEIGTDLVRIKQPSFDHNEQFRADVFRSRFDFIVAQSIFSHTSSDVAIRALGGFREALEPKGLVACTFIEVPESERAEHPSGWIYPGCVGFTRDEIGGFMSAVGLEVRRIPWYHPRQTWYLAAIDPSRLPLDDQLRHLSGAVLNDPAFVTSVRSAT